MSITGILVLVAAVVAVGFIIWFVTRAPEDPGYVAITSDSRSGKMSYSSTASLPRSENQAEGAVFSYSCWILVNDFTLNYGQRRRIFSKGDCPGLYLDGTSNSLLVAVNTFGAQETVLIPNIPAKKWVHFAMTVDQYAVNIYINGRLRLFHTLNQLPKQNDDKLEMGPSWDGVLANLRYYPRALSMAEVDAMSREEVPSDMYQKPSAPQYFDMTWYTGRTGQTSPN
jgi:hypothetical protein